MRSHRKRRAAVAVGVIAVAAAVAAGIVVSSSLGGDDDDTSAQAGPTATPTTASPSLNEDGSIALPTSDPTDVATDEPLTAAPDTDAAILVTYAGWDETEGVVEISGYVDRVSEDDGTCTATFTGGAADPVEVTGPGTANGASTSCGRLTVPGGELASGTWTAVLTYESDDSAGSSDPVEVEVP
ncbi:hypothetical protein [Blastococcus sp. TF02A-26]|uniref:hypothetical protein n=1 Tax=Blastococcus sp. TF02A-26 TaxID=2250577 RepID=UPI000DE9DB07|nr:hypothetical protein [Blastococcus sp. TF02A-26]RBY89854.1 hypothetical protein DQ240_02815 [Blastococcus sp. TF02A-26]